MSPLLRGIGCQSWQRWVLNCVLQEWLDSPLQIAHFSGGASGFFHIHVNRSHLFLIAPTVGRLVSLRACRPAAVPSFGEVRGSVWRGFIIFPLRLCAGGRKPAWRGRVVNRDIPKVLRDVVR